jgi:dCMP deaminase
MRDLLSSTGQFESVEVLGAKDLSKLDQTGTRLIMPDEDISRELGNSLKKAKPVYKPVFLRWDRRSLEENAKPLAGEKLSSRKPDLDKMKLALEVASQSSDIWRRVGAVLISKDGTVIGTASNQGEPSSQTPWVEGDPRNIFNKGIGIEMSLFIHAEAALIANAAKDGVSLNGATMYATTFPCPACAKLIAHSGISNLFYSEGYGVLDGQRVLEEYNVGLQRVLQQPDDKYPEAWVPYKKPK